MHKPNTIYLDAVVFVGCDLLQITQHFSLLDQSTHGVGTCKVHSQTMQQANNCECILQLLL